MKKQIALWCILAGLLFTPSLFAHGKLVNINLQGNGAYPLGSELTKVTANAGSDCMNAGVVCNPAFFGAGGGGGLDIKLPYGIGLGVLFTFHAFLRKEDPEPNEADLASFNAIQIFVPEVYLRILDMVPSYQKKWGTLILGVGPGIGWLYQELHVAVKAGLAYMYPVYDIEAFTVQIGLGVDFVYQHPFAAGYDDDMYLNFGLRMSFGVVKEPWGKKGKKKGEVEGEMGAQVSDEMKQKDTDGDGLSDYCELMMGTNSTSKDSDEDGLFDSEEDKNKNCVRDDGETDPAVADTDGGGTPDGWEVKAGYDPIDPDDDDKDQDFIMDHQDNCLGTPRGVAVNERGCPTIIEATLLEGVTFEPGTATLTADGEVALENWAAVLMDSPQLKFEILAYTDSKGNKKKLIKLSKDRAQVVYDFFASKGVSESRMTFKGKGPASPIASNKTPEGREQNNRIELVPVD